MNYDHLLALTTPSGIFEHCMEQAPLPEHGYCVDDVAREVMRARAVRDHPGAVVRDLLEAHYADSHVVDVLPEGVVPELARVQQTDGAELGVFEDALHGRSERYAQWLDVVPIPART